MSPPSMFHKIMVSGRLLIIFLIPVMRLTKPQLMTTVPVMGEPWDMLGAALEKEQLKDIRTIKGLPELSTGEMLGLPQSFG